MSNKSGYKEEIYKNLEAIHIAHASRQHSQIISPKLQLHIRRQRAQSFKTTPSGRNRCLCANVGWPSQMLDQGLSPEGSSSKPEGTPKKIPYQVIHNRIPYSSKMLFFGGLKFSSSSIPSNLIPQKKVLFPNVAYKLHLDIYFITYFIPKLDLGTY